MAFEGCSELEQPLSLCAGFLGGAVRGWSRSCGKCVVRDFCALDFMSSGNSQYGCAVVRGAECATLQLNIRIITNLNKCCSCVVLVIVVVRNMGCHRYPATLRSSSPAEVFLALSALVAVLERLLLRVVFSCRMGLGPNPFPNRLEFGGITTAENRRHWVPDRISKHHVFSGRAVGNVFSTGGFTAAA